MRVIQRFYSRITNHVRELQKCSSGAGLRRITRRDARMSKKHVITFRLDGDEMTEIERICKTLRLSKTDYLRAVSLGGSKPIGPPPAVPAAAMDDSRLASLEAGQRDIQMALNDSAAAFAALMTNLNEFLRIPSFREYRARDLAGNSIKRDGEAEEIYLLRLAHRYFIQYQVWPDPEDKTKFGPAPGADLAKFPRIKPAG